MRSSFFLAVLLVASACVRAPVAPPAPPIVEEADPTPEEALVAVEREDLPLLLDDGDRESLALALERNRSWLGRQPADRVFRFGERAVAAAALRRAYDEVSGWLAEDLTPEALAVRVAREFDVVESVGSPRGEMLITGYYEPVIDGALSPSAAYPVPVYGPPGDMVRADLGEFADDLAGRRIAGRVRGGKLVPYPDRREIRTTGTLRGREIAWAKDPVDLFFIEIQGSGALRLPGGGEMRIGYAGSNGRQYRSIGKLLIDEGKIERERVSMQSIRAYLAAHPEERDRVLDYNASVVFFRRLDGPPVGSLGVPVTPRRSIATDHRFIPPGALGFLITEVPAADAEGRTVAAGALRRFVLNHDRGGAIKGPGRVDFFWGRGEEAAERAGLMKQPGRLLLLLPRKESDEAS